jgi:hypothetical protein
LIAGGLASRCLIVGLCGLIAMCAAAPTARGALAEWPESPLGSHAMLYLDAPYGFKRTMFQQSADLGARSIRVDLALTAIFTTDAAEHWQQVDEVLALARHFRLRPVGVLLATPWFIAACGEEGYSYKCPPADIEGWKRMIAAIVARTRGVIDTFEILNEPDGRWAFTGSAADYARLLRAGHDTIKAANPHAKVAIAGTMSLGSRHWLAQVFADAGPHPEHLYDIANVHIRARLHQLPETLRTWRKFFTAHHAGNKPLWVTEFGYPSDPAYQYDRAYHSGPASQASYLCRALPALLRSGAAKVFVTLRDNLGGPFASEGVIGGAVSDPPTADPRIVRKPAFTELSQIARSL